MTKSLGEGIFSAYRQNGIVYVLARGQKPSPQTQVAIEEQPIFTNPPRLSLTFETLVLDIQQETSFFVERAFPKYQSFTKTIDMADRHGLHRVDIIDRPGD